MKENQNYPEIGIGILGYGFMGKAFSNGFLQMTNIYWPPPAWPKLMMICGRNKKKVKEAAKRFGFKYYSTNWEDLFNEDKIDLFVNCGPNNIHAKPCIEAAKNKKHIICEKPLGLNAKEAKEMYITANKEGIKHVCNYIFRTVPAIVMLKRIITEEKLGQIYNFRGKFLTDYSMGSNTTIVWRNIKKYAGYGVLGDLTTHIIDLARYLVGEVDYVYGENNTYIKYKKTNNKKKIDLDDSSICILKFKSNASGVIESSSISRGHSNSLEIEISGEYGSAYWSFERINLIYLYLEKNRNSEEKGFKTIKVVSDNSPYYSKWSEFGSTTGINYMNLFSNVIFEMFNLITNNNKFYSKLATFKDGYIANMICDAIQESSIIGKKVELVSRPT